MINRKLVEYLAMAALLLAFLGYFSVKVWDIDFWWHIATGKVILENAAIPGADPFGVFDANNVWGQTILKSQWLGEVVLYGVYRWFDIDGIILFRAVVLTSCLAIVYLRCRIASVGSMVALPLTALTGMAILHHTGERPQLFSFLYLSLIFLLFDSFLRSGKRWQLYGIPLVMLLWSNTHGGAVLGAVAIGLFGAGCMIERRWATGRFDTPENRLMLLAVIISAVVLVMAPNGITTFKHIIALESNPIRNITSEYASPLSLWPATVYYWIFISVTVLSLPGFVRDKAFWKQGAVVVAIGAISLTGFRYIPLFVLMAAPYVATSLGRMAERMRLPQNNVAAEVAILVAALALLAYGHAQGKVFQRGLQEQRFPLGAVFFLKDSQLGGRIFNTLNWGGYLIWNLPGKVTVYVDGRMLDPTRIVPYTHILWVTPEGRQFFEQGNFNLALVPYGNAFSGERYPLVDYLLHHPGWQAVYQDDKGYLFARQTAK